MTEFNTDDPLGFFITWTAYGAWLPGDERGYIEWHNGWQPPCKELESYADSIMVEPPVRLTRVERDRVEQTVGRHCTFRNWKLWDVNARTTHVHAVVTAPGYDPEEVRNQLKAWCTRELRAHDTSGRQHWWAEGGSARCLNDEDSLDRAIAYTREGQDRPRA